MMAVDVLQGERLQTGALALRTRIEHIGDGDVGMGKTEDVLPLGALPHEVVVVLLLVALGEDRAAQVLTILRGDVTETETTVDSPVCADALLVTEVQVGVDVLTLVTMAALPLEVVVTHGGGKTDVPSVERVMALAVAEPVAELQSPVEELLSVCIVAPRPPRQEDLSLDAPAVLVAERDLELHIRSDETPHEQVGLDGPEGTMVNNLARYGLGEIINGILINNNDGVLLRHGEVSDDGHTRSAEHREVALVQVAPDGTATQPAQLLLTRVYTPVVLCRSLREDAEHIFAPLLVALVDHLVELTPTCALVDDSHLRCHLTQSLLQQVPQGDATLLTEPPIELGGAFRRGTGDDIELQLAHGHRAVVFLH